MAVLSCFKVFLVLCVCSRAVCNDEDVIEYLQALKRSCEEAERMWMSMDINLMEYVHRKIQDHLNILMYIVAICADSGELATLLETLYNRVLDIFRHYSSLLDHARREDSDEGIARPSVERTGRRGRPR